MLPEFQRDFRWELEQTYDLIDSLIREIFIGTLIYGKPSFGMTLREIDKRPRKGIGSRISLSTRDYTSDQIKIEVQTNNLRVVLDGQQRITSLYRAITGKGNDNIFLILKNDIDVNKIAQIELEDMLEEIGGEESISHLSLKLSDAYNVEIGNLDDDDIREQFFAKTLYGQDCIKCMDSEKLKIQQKIYRKALKNIIDLFMKQKMVAYYMLDMSLDKFCIFFERSNSRGIQLNFTDILAAKLYHGFNLRKKIDEFKSGSQFDLNRELIIRAIAYIVSTEGKGPTKIDKKHILENLDAEDFQKHWDEICRLYKDVLSYLADQHYILSQSWMPSENMLIPLMVFLRKIKSFGQMSQDQKEFIQYWYWSSIFANRYSTSSNETIIQDCAVMLQIANSERISARGYFSKLRPLVTEPSDLFSYTRRASSIYRGVLNLLNFASKGLKDWNNTQTLTISMALEDHHIYPRAYIANTNDLDISQEEAEQLVDCVLNRTLIPKLTNITIGKKSPTVYMREIAGRNGNLPECLSSHLIPHEIIEDGIWSTFFKAFLDERANRLFALIEEHTSDRLTEMSKRFATISEVEVIQNSGSRMRLKDLIAQGRIKIGDRVYTQKKKMSFASILDSEYVEFEGSKMLINSWGQMMTGWQSISIYASVYLERTGDTIGALRNSD